MNQIIKYDAYYDKSIISMSYENILFYIFKRKRSENLLYSQKEAHAQEAKTLTIYL
jgi:hypothetical protein